MDFHAEDIVRLNTGGQSVQIDTKHLQARQDALKQQPTGSNQITEEKAKDGRDSRTRNKNFLLFRIECQALPFGRFLQPVFVFGPRRFLSVMEGRTTLGLVLVEK